MPKYLLSWYPLAFIWPPFYFIKIYVLLIEFSQYVDFSLSKTYAEFSNYVVKSSHYKIYRCPHCWESGRSVKLGGNSWKTDFSFFHSFTNHHLWNVAQLLKCILKVQEANLTLGDTGLYNKHDPSWYYGQEKNIKIKKKMKMKKMQIKI